jgi:hypothetical protein
VLSVPESIVEGWKKTFNTKGDSAFVHGEGRAKVELEEDLDQDRPERRLRQEQAPEERKARIHLAVAPTKQMERFEWFLEKATD